MIESCLCRVSFVSCEIEDDLRTTRSLILSKYLDSYPTQEINELSNNSLVSIYLIRFILNTYITHPPTHQNLIQLHY